MIHAGSAAAFVVLFLVGVLLVIWCVEVFVEAVAQSAVSLGISGFFLAVVLAGVDLENAVLGVTAAVVELPGLALGTVFGESLFVLAIAVGIAGIFVPFRANVPRAYLALLLLVPVPAFAASLGGRIDATEGAVLTALFLPLLAFIFQRERSSETKFLVAEEVEEVVELEESEAEVVPDGDAEPTADGGLVPDLGFDPDEFVPDLERRSGLFNLGVAVLATVGMTAGSTITVVSAERLFVALGISGLAFGATVLSFIASIEELALTVEPARQGRSHIAVGNIVGSTVFYLTANLGIVALLHPISTAGAVMTVHWPFLVGCLLVVTAMLARGRVTRGGGLLLVGLYAAYWAIIYG